jgi:hypothetical protein
MRAKLRPSGSDHTRRSEWPFPDAVGISKCQRSVLCARSVIPQNCTSLAVSKIQTNALEREHENELRNSRQHHSRARASARRRLIRRVGSMGILGIPTTEGLKITRTIDDTAARLGAILGRQPAAQGFNIDEIAADAVQLARAGAKARRALERGRLPAADVRAATGLAGRYGA